MSLDRVNDPEPTGPVVPASRSGGAALRAAPRLGVAALAAVALGFSVAGSSPGIPAFVQDWLWLPLSAAAIPSSPKRWWRYVKHGKQEPWLVNHSGTTRLFVTDPGRNRVAVAALLREHGPLDLGEAVQRIGDPTSPVWEDLADDSADRLSVLLEEAGATVRIETGP